MGWTWPARSSRSGSVRTERGADKGFKGVPIAMGGDTPFDEDLVVFGDRRPCHPPPSAAQRRRAADRRRAAGRQDRTSARISGCTTPPVGPDVAACRRSLSKHGAAHEGVRHCACRRELHWGRQGWQEKRGGRPQGCGTRDTPSSGGGGSRRRTRRRDSGSARDAVAGVGLRARQIAR